MYKEMKNLIGQFLFFSVVIACVVLFFCGSITAAQRTAYNAYLREYAVLSMSNQGEKVKMEGLSKEISFTVPEKAQVEKYFRYMKLTPLASVVFFFESAEDILSEIFPNVLT